MKRIFPFALAILLSFVCFHLISPNEKIFADVENEMPIIQTSITPNVIYDNEDFVENEYTVKNPIIQSYDFLFTDKYIFFNSLSLSGFTNIDNNSISIEFDEFSTDPNIAQVEFNDSPTLLQSKVKINGMGSCYLFYTGTFSVITLDYPQTYFFRGQILINITDYTVYEMSYLTETVLMTSIDDGLSSNNENYEVTVYNAIINDNPNLTKYNRERIYWKVNESIRTGNTFSAHEGNRLFADYKNHLTLNYDNTSWLENQEATEVDDYCKVINNVQPTNPSEKATIDQFWWLFDILILGLIIVAFIIYTKFQDSGVLESVVNHIKSYDLNVQKIKTAFEKPKRNERKERAYLRACYYDLLFACQFCESAIKEDYYELTVCYDALHQNQLKFATFRKNYDKFDENKIIKLLDNIRKNINPSYKLICKTIENKKILEDKLQKEHENREEIKEKIKEKAKKNIISAEALQQELEDVDFAKVDNQASVNNNENDNAVAAILINDTLQNLNNEDK